MLKLSKQRNLKCKWQSKISISRKKYGYNINRIPSKTGYYIGNQLCCITIFKVCRIRKEPMNIIWKFEKYCENNSFPLWSMWYTKSQSDWNKQIEAKWFKEGKRGYFSILIMEANEIRMSINFTFKTMGPMEKV